MTTSRSAPRPAVVAAALALVLPVLFSPVVAVGFWLPRYALLPIEAALGLPLLIDRIRAGSRPAVLAAVFAAWVIVCTALAAGRGTAFWGLEPLGTAGLFVLAIVGTWALGLACGDVGRRWIENAVLVGAAVNASVALLQRLVDLQAIHLERVGGQSDGLLGGPVYLGGFLAASVWIVVPRLRRRPIGWMLYLALVGAGLQANASRFPLLLLVVVVTGALVAVGPRAALLAAVALALGLGAASVPSQQSGGVSATSRFQAQQASGLGVRVDIWKAGGRAALRRPLVGYGPNGTRQATERDRTLRVARDGPDRIYTDAHNIVVEYAVTTGFVGALLFIAWLATVVAGAGWSSPLAGFGVLLLAIHMLQPQNVVTTPIMFLALGAAAATPAPQRKGPSWARVTPVAVAAVGAVVLIAGGWFLDQARLNFDARAAQRARALLPAWPDPPLVTARIVSFDARVRRDPALAAKSRHWRRVAIARSPFDPALWYGLAEDEYDAGLIGDARRDFARAAALDPWSVHAANGLGRIALRGGDHAGAARWFTRSLLVLPNQPSIRKLLGEAEAAQPDVSQTAP